ncbi:MAG TPA: ribokinase [Woeseiaceae bacterium]|nr:ribokinase [Woeseiaceae bacterium]
MTRILVLGSVNLDYSASVSRLPVPGETITGATLERIPGGKGANQALAAQRLGASVQLIAAVGNDANADDALCLLRAAGVDLSRCVVKVEVPTGVALICVAASGENHIVVAPGANAMLSPADFELPDADAMICQLEVPIATILSVVDEFAGFFCVNLAPAREIDDAVLKRADLLVVNETEAAWYGARLDLCSGFIATTLGANGAQLTQRGIELARVRAPAVEVVDSTGAGDAFTAALTIALVEGMAPAAALTSACAAGALATTKRGAQPSLPTRAQLEAFT